MSSQPHIKIYLVFIGFSFLLLIFWLRAKLSCHSSLINSREREYLESILTRFSPYKTGLFGGSISKYTCNWLLKRYNLMDLGMRFEYYFFTKAWSTVQIAVPDNFSQLHNWFLSSKRFILRGDAGVGKTTTLEYFAYNLANSNLRHCTKSVIFPIFVQLGSYAGQDFDQFLAQTFSGFCLSEYLPDQLFFLLDGLDEIPPEYIANVNNWISEHPDISIIISCRKSFYVENNIYSHLVQNNQLEIIELSSFS